MKALRIALAAALLVAAQGPAHAGRSCEPRQPDPVAVQRGLDLAQRTAKALDATGARVVVLARAGQDLTRYRLRWSHLGYAYKTDATPSGPGVWRVAHKLNHCATDRADIYRQGLAEFFTDDPYELVAGIAVLAPEVQRHLLPVLQDNARLAALHEPAYSIVAYPWALTYQQSNQWAIETLAAAEEPEAGTRERAQAWLRFKGYEPTTLHLSAWTRLGARMTAANVAFDDHPNEKRYGDRIETVTADSVFAWLQRSGLAQPMRVVR